MILPNMFRTAATGLLSKRESLGRSSHDAQRKRKDEYLIGSFICLSVRLLRQFALNLLIQEEQILIYTNQMI